MGIEIPVDLIKRLNNSLRKEAKLSSYDPDGDSLPSLPSADEAIAELDASAPYLRCRNCKGKLLRGIESLICVFCGKQQRTSDNPPDPIKFTSTSGYKWFLSSLSLDGSEIVEPPKETTGSGRGRNPPIEGIAVSKFLDLEIQWGVKEEKFENSGTGHGKSAQSKIPLNLGGFNLDDFFFEGTGGHSKVEVAESQPEEDDFNDPRSLSSNNNVKSQVVGELHQHENVSLFVGKNAQGSLSSEEQENLSLFVGQDSQESVSQAAHENLSLFEGKDVRENNSFQGHEHLSLFEGKDAKKASSSKEEPNLGFFESAAFPTVTVKSVDDKFVDSSMDWDTDFQYSKQNVSEEQKPGSPFANSSVDLAAHMDTVFGSGKVLFETKPKDALVASASSTGDWFQDDIFSNVNPEAQKNNSSVHNRSEEQIVEKNGTSSMDIDWIGDDLWQSSDKKASDKIPTDEDEDWNDFASSANSKTPNDSLSQTVVSFQEDTLDSMANGKNGGRTQGEYSSFPSMNWAEDEQQDVGTNTLPDLTKDQDDDLLGAWNSFTTSVATQVPLQDSSKHMELSAKENSEINLFGEANDHQGFDFGSFSSADFFSGGIGGQNNSAEVKIVQSETSTSERRVDATDKDQILESTSTFGDPIGAKSKGDTVEELMSQMHDLSFMLKNELSVPQNIKTEQTKLLQNLRLN